MATQKTGRPTQAGDSAIRQTANAVGSMLETGASLVGRGVAAGVEGAGALADRAAEMTGITSPADAGRAAGRVADRAIESTMSMGRSVAAGTRRMAGTTGRAADRAVTTAARVIKPRKSTASHASKRNAGRGKKRTAGAAAKRTASTATKRVARGGRTSKSKASKAGRRSSVRSKRRAK